MLADLIGIALLIYGLVGVVATLLIYWWIARPQGAMHALRGFLQSVADKLGDGGVSAGRALQMAHDAKTMLQATTAELQPIVTHVRDVSGFLNTAGSRLSGVQTVLNSVKVPALAPTTTQLQGSASAPVITKVHLSTYRDPLNTFDIWGPPVTYDTTPITLSLGPTSVITGLGLTDAYPLAPVGQAFGDAGQRFGEAGQKADQIASYVDRIKTLANDARQMIDVMIAEVLTALPGTLQNASQQIRQMSTSSLLGLIPLLGLGYFGLIHLAFALTGLALLVV